MRALEAISSATEVVICVNNEGYEVDLKPWGVYEVVPDERLRSGYIRVIDESGEDYIYPVGRFASPSDIRHSRPAF
jgi:hypothetical protein